MKAFRPRFDGGSHRRPGKAHTAAYLPGEGGHAPRHCAGELDNGLCLSHDHPGDAPMQVFAGLHVPVTAAQPARVPIAGQPIMRVAKR